MCVYLVPMIVLGMLYVELHVTNSGTCTTRVAPGKGVLAQICALGVAWIELQQRRRSFIPGKILGDKENWR